MDERLSLATASGLPLLALAFHVAMGTAALAVGIIALAARKGGQWHRRSGVLFVYTMIAMGLTAVGIALYEGKEDFTSGAVAVYLVLSAWTTVKPLPVIGRRVDIALMILAFVYAAAGYVHAFSALDQPGNQINGVPAGMLFFMTTIIFLAAVGDLRMIVAGGIRGTRRLARHLWRMCFGLFIATGSFAAQLVQMEYMPDQMRNLWVILLLGGAPLVLLLYWMWRVRVRQNLRGLLTTKPVEVHKPA